MEEGKGLVCVTGGAGFVASWLIMRLLEHGYTVRTTIRSSPGEHTFSPLILKILVFALPKLVWLHIAKVFVTQLIFLSFILN